MFLISSDFGELGKDQASDGIFDRLQQLGVICDGYV